MNSNASIIGTRAVAVIGGAGLVVRVEGQRPLILLDKGGYGWGERIDSK